MPNYQIHDETTSSHNKHTSILFVMTYCVQIVKFLAIGSLTFAVNLSIFHVFYGTFKFDYLMAITISYSISLILHFTLNRYFAFNANKQDFKRSLFKYILVVAFNYLITLVVILITTEVMMFSPYIGLVLSIAVTACLTFFLMKYFIFSKKPTSL